MQRYHWQGACALVAAGLLAACTEQAFQLGFQQDVTPPTVAIVVPGNDTINVQNGFAFTVDATDNLGLKTITVTLTAGLTAHDTTFTTAVTNIGWVVVVPQSETATLGGPVLITATAVDGNNNATTDTVTVFATNPKALIVTLVRPTPGAVTAPGKQLLVQVNASQVDGLQLVGWRTIPGGAAVSARDTLYTPGLPPDTSLVDTLDIPATIAQGTFSIVGFAKDASDRIVTTSPVVVTVQLVTTDTTGPLVTFSVPQRAEVTDSIAVRARDPSGVSAIGWVAFSTGGTQVGGASNNAVGGTLTDVTQSWAMDLNLGATPPQKVIIKAWATDANGNTDSARVDTLNLGSAVRADTINIVNGVTVALPAGGKVADAIYNPNRNEVYLTNVALDRVEVFSVTDTSFHAAIPVGSRPWGIALWPRDTLTGANADTVVVANSGGTNLSVVNVATGAEVRRVPLPLFDVQTVHTQIDPNSGTLQKTYKQYFFSDRPEYVGMVCGGQTCRPGGTGEVYAVYSTTPTSGQSTPFSDRGSMRWEDLTTAGQSHFFWEHAISGFSPSNDTLQINRRDPVTNAVTPLLDALCGVIVPATELAFEDTTFVRNSGNFTRVIVGEGGSGTPVLAYSRTLTYDVTGTKTATCAGGYALNEDAGVSPALNVRSNIANTALHVQSVGINFNGLTELVRFSDSVYVLARGLRLTGLLSIGGPNWGMDLNFIHDYDAVTGLSSGSFAHTPTANADRVAFVASPDPEIDVYDTYHFGKIGTIPIKDPVIGPLRVAKLASGVQILIGVTIDGVVVVQLPALANPYTNSAGWSGGQE
jgi:hypothetical protein